jgi:hypothetical protein
MVLRGGRDACESVDVFLRFKPPSLEEEFQLENSRRRIHSAYRVDAALFVVLALFMACGWPRVYGTGHPQELPYMLMSGIVYTALACLYLIRAQPGSLVELVQIKLRLFLQIFCYLLATIQFSRHIGLDNMGLCSPFNPDYSSFEALVIYLLWVASYPTIAAIPLKYTVLIQPILFLFLHEPSERECAMGDGCAKTDEMYDLYASTMGWWMPSMVPFSSTKREMGSDPGRHCMAMMFYWKMFIVVFVGVYVTHFFEVRVRRLYVIESRKGHVLVEQMNLKRVGGGQIFLEMLLCMGLTWVITQMFILAPPGATG